MIKGWLKINWRYHGCRQVLHDDGYSRTSALLHPEGGRAVRKAWIRSDGTCFMETVEPKSEPIGLTIFIMIKRA